MAPESPGISYQYPLSGSARILGPKMAPLLDLDQADLAQWLAACPST